MKHKGMRQIATVQGLIVRAKPTTRVGMVTKLARLEHEQARLEVELNVWLGKCKEAEQHLQEVQEEIELLRRTLWDFPAGEEGRGAAEGDGKGEGWREIPLRY